MKIRIQSDGVAVNAENNRKLGNVISQPLRKFSSTRNMHVEIELPNFHCNVGGTDPTTGQRACLVCPRNAQRFQPDKDRVSEVCQAIKAQLDQVSVLRIGGYAEPFWKDRIFDVLAELELDAENTPKIFTTTNGTLLNEERTARWFETIGACEVSFSIDATKPKTYVQLRRISEFERAVQNMDHYCRTRNPDQHVAVLRNNINLINIDEVEEMVRMTQKHFLHYLALSPTRPINKKLREICLNPQNESQFAEARAKAQQEADSLGVNVVFSGDWPA